MDNVCPICLVVLGCKSESIETLCKHTFHRNCLYEYDDYCIRNQKNLICPLCNHPLDHLNPKTSPPPVLPQPAATTINIDLSTTTTTNCDSVLESIDNTRRTANLLWRLTFAFSVTTLLSFLAWLTMHDG